MELLRTHGTALMTSYHAHCYWSQRSPEHEVPVTWEILLPPPVYVLEPAEPPVTVPLEPEYPQPKQPPGAWCLVPVTARRRFSYTWWCARRCPQHGCMTCVSSRPASDPRARQ
ncbi:hypothetical protein SAMN04490220_2008 [Rhodococcus jostii]|uniref:Uncharacterized protein n=1 Tax=Rhodococcus jostii TaxID=132919 RepID=A0A1H4TPB4_RHOJO|nr:hypothetical protein SAMN04490220_2008 [Rhodococcus jostii]